MLLSFHQVSFTYPDAYEPVFEDVTFTAGPGWTGVLGANGAGKSTLLQLATGELRPDRGLVRAPIDGHVCPQRTDVAPAGFEALLSADDARTRHLRQVLRVEAHWLGQWEQLSHGERKRAQLVVALAGEPAFLVVDEPTNHLDREAKQWVAEALASFRGIGLLVSHDRALLDALCKQCLFIEAGQVVVHAGDYTQAARQRANERTAHVRARAKADRELARLLGERTERRLQTEKGERQRSKRGLARGDSDGRAKADGARVADSGSGQRLRQMDGRIRQAEARSQALSMARAFQRGVRLEGERAAGPRLLHLPEGEIPLGPSRVLWVPSLVIGPADRIGIVGPNGAGKSTLVRRMAHRMEASRAWVSVIPQEIDLQQSRAILEAFKAMPPEQLGRAMALVRRLGSDPAMLLQSAEPSPGELRKLLLGSCVIAQPNLLILDEPTNHLDLPAIECLEEALAGFPAALVLVSHDEHLLARLATRIWSLSAESPNRARWRLEEGELSA